MRRDTTVITEADIFFYLYENMKPQQACKPDSRVDHGLRFQKFFGRVAENGELNLGNDRKLKLSDKLPTRTNRPGKDPSFSSIQADHIHNWFDVRLKDQEVRKKEKLRLATGDTDRLEAACDRLKTLAEARVRAQFGADAKIDDATFELPLVSRLFSGIGLPHPTENGFLFHPTLAVPYLRGTALKQVARDFAEEEYNWRDWWNKDEVESDDTERIKNAALNRLFGGVDGNRPTNAGCLAFLDALPTGPVTLTAEQITSHYGPYYQNVDPARPSPSRDDMHQPADWHEPNPVTLLAVDASFERPLTFRLAIVPLKGAKADDVAAAAKWLRQGLELHGVGARTTLGFGRFMTEAGVEAAMEALAAHQEELKKRQEALRQAEKQQELAQKIEARQTYPIGTKVRFDDIVWDLTEPHRLGSGEKVRLYQTSEGHASADEDEIDEWDVQE